MGDKKNVISSDTGIPIFVWKRSHDKTICITEEDLKRAKNYLLRCILEANMDSELHEYYSTFDTALEYLYNEAFGGKTNAKENSDETRNHYDC